MKYLNHFNFNELSKNEMHVILGGYRAWSYANYTWSDTSNPIIYTVEAGVNGSKATLQWCSLAC